MADIEKVLKALDCEEYKKCVECPYKKFHKCDVLLIRDVRELLKERVKTKVVFGRTKDGEFVTECGNCGTHLDKAYSNCPKCKKELDWNSCQS